jgi:branched-chain amino acid transport system substrate-binding protein
MRLARWCIASMCSLTVAATALTVSSTAASASEKSPIVIGNVSTLSGPEAAPGGAGSLVPTLSASVKAMNAAGGINGHPVKLITMDDGGSPAVAASDVASLIQSDHIVALVGESDTYDELSWQKVVDKAKVPVIGGFANDLEWQSDPNYFPSSTTGQAYTESVTAVAKQAGGKSFGFPYCVESAICKQVIPIVKSGAKVEGLKWAGAVAVSASAPNYTAPCLQLQSAGANVLFESVPEPVRFVDACASQGFRPKEVICCGEDSTPGLTKDPAFNGTYSAESSFPWFLHNNATAPYFAAMKKYAPSTKLSGNSTTEWTAGKLFQAAAEQAQGPVTSTSLINTLRGMKNETLGGLTPGPLDFADATFHPVNCVFAIQLKHGHWTAPAGMKTDCVSSSSYEGVKPGS